MENRQELSDLSNRIPEIIAFLCESPNDIQEHILKEYAKWSNFDVFYEPSPELIARLDDYQRWCRKEIVENPGKLMEEIVVLAFMCLKGWDDLESYQSYSHQHDLLISGSDGLWKSLMEHLHLPKSGRSVLVEAKNTKNKVNVQQFARVCHILQHQLASTCHLGVFITREGATGFSMRRYLRDSRATQVLFHATTGKFIVVFDHEDILKLSQKGDLPRLLEAKIKDVERGSNISDNFSENWQKVNLPSHLAQWVKT